MHASCSRLSSSSYPSPCCCCSSASQILVDQLQKRYNDDRIYTYVGDILVAVNPFRPLTIYSRENQKLYDATLNRTAPPHIYAVADAATYYLRSSGTNQCCIVSGESGAGKTESAKYVIRQLISLCRDRRNADDNNLEEKILQVNPIMEAFGNAMTVMNDNSSRFGKYTELVFDSKGKVRARTTVRVQNVHTDPVSF